MPLPLRSAGRITPLPHQTRFFGPKLKNKSAEVKDPLGPDRERGGGGERRVRQAGRQADRQAERQRDRQTDRQTEKQRDRRTDKRTDRQTDRQTDTHTHTHSARARARD